MSDAKRVTPKDAYLIAETAGRLIGTVEAMVNEFQSAAVIEFAYHAGRWPVQADMTDDHDPAAWRAYLARVCRRAAELLEGGT